MKKTKKKAIMIARKQTTNKIMFYRKETTMKKVIQILLICLIIAGTIVTATVGFNVGLKYSEHDEISINVGSKFNVADIKATAKEVFGNSNVLVQQVELYKDMVQITVKEATEEQITTLNDKINEKYKIENQLTDIKVVHTPNVRLRNIIKPYILPISIVSIITIVFAMIVFRKLGALKVAYEVAISIVAPQVILASLYAVTRIPINRLTSIIAIIIFIISLVLPMVKLNKVKEEKVPTVLKMELSNDNIAKAIAEATGTDVKVFYSCHNLTAQEFKDGETYLSMMEKNVETLKEVLNGWH